jgi:glycosyltransferase involved in cell wall biosynthesis
MDRTETRLSIILPVYNEAESLKIMVQILEATLETPHEVLVVYDFPEDNSVDAARWLQNKYGNVNLVFNDLGRGAANAIKKGISVARGDIVLIALVDEVFPIAAIGDMLELMDNGCDFVSCTRYALGGKRLGGSLIGGMLSRFANKLFKVIAGSVLSDATTGMKMVRKRVFNMITIEANTGWAFAFEISIKAQMLGLKVGEVPVVSVDRLFGGDSTFKLGSWVREYMKWFVWGAIHIRRSKRPQQEAVTLQKYRRR